MALFRYLYSVAYRVVIAFISVFSPKESKIRRWYEARNSESPIPVLKGSIWFHCASLGEFEQCRPVLEELKSLYPEKPVVLTFFSPSGYEVRKDYPKADLVRYLPFDLPADMASFIDSIDPELCILVKYELWPNMLFQLRQKGCPKILIGAYFRENHHYFTWFGYPFRNMLYNLDKIFVQDQSSMTRMASIGIKNAILAGDPRLDRVKEIAAQDADYPKISAFSKGHKVWVWGSTWPMDEKLLKKALDWLPETWKIILVPHEVGTSRIKEIKTLFNNQLSIYSRPENENPTNSKIMLIDQIGLLAYLYRFGDLSYVGGGFTKGIHSIQEAFIYRLPVIFGPNYQKFREARMLVSMGGAYVVNGNSELQKTWQSLQETPKKDKAVKAIDDFIAQNLGATHIIIDSIRGNYLGST